MNDLERAFRLYARPVLLVIIGLFVMGLVAMTPESAGVFDQVLMPIKRAIFYGALVVGGAGFLWLCWSAYLEYRWARGELDGGCHNCGGPMRHLSGRWGNYSKCLMCGSTREGWH
ncbi:MULTISPECIES: hypothetical protein [Pseudomonas]|uniref:hypothetical protein n=1 Tax=Pseudomonas TaxID=286 RepID=UPI0005962A77|nr:MULTISPECIES: hypothetical protein [Pseudomonas]QGF21356.1 hypothetical protein [Pseudomonas phage AUS531phi]KSK89396.1 hypothetical protein APA49_24520 [Pseudomonas aeruginosa]MBI7308348.1 hypothetical protein [Pseudomonas aeruginosa]MBX6026665.1 hypothetical protein [Pseudomonas aeruginosa]MCO7709789.1 hypothetical protein [Pseudomonas aeruginosa]